MASTSQMNFDDLDSNKKIYLQQMNQKPELLFNHFVTRQSTEQKIKELAGQRGNKDAVTTTDLTVVKRHGIPKLLKRVKKLFLEVIPVEDAFDIVFKTHIECKHGDALTMYEILKTKFYVPMFCVNWVINSCNVCNPRDLMIPAVEPVKREPVKTTSQRVWRMNIIKHTDLVKNKYGALYLLIYKENTTNFLVLRPLFDSSEKFCIDIFKLFVEFGYPEKVLVPNLIKFYKAVFDMVYAINPTIKVLVEEAPNDIFEEDAYEVMTEIRKWMKSTNKIYWSQGCHIVQYKMNTRVRYITTIGSDVTMFGIPFNLFFNFEFDPSTRDSDNIIMSQPSTSEKCDHNMDE